MPSRHERLSVRVLRLAILLPEAGSPPASRGASTPRLQRFFNCSKPRQIKVGDLLSPEKSAAKTQEEANSSPSGHGRCERRSSTDDADATGSLIQLGAQR
ncbi:MAG TPA: hypothetical protein PLS55_14415, partial [Thermogutta sp.]|nr:hypothetical protein [Thermogutta sp.]